MNINIWIKVAKIAGMLLPAVGTIAGAWANNKENGKIVAKTTEELFKKQQSDK